MKFHLPFNLSQHYTLIIRSTLIENMQQTVDKLLGTHPEAVVVPEGPCVVGRTV